MISFAVLVSDEDYAEGLEKYLSAKVSGDVKFGVYTRYESFEEFIREQKPQVLVVEDGLKAEQLQTPIIWLTGNQESAGVKGIGMYRNLESVANDITEETKALIEQGYVKETDVGFISEMIDEKPSKADQNNDFSKKIADVDVRRSINGVPSQIICVCSPFGGTYASTYAYALASYYSKGARTLFVSLDPFFNPDPETFTRSRGGLGKFIYLLDASDNLAIEKCTQRIGALDCICGSDHWSDLFDITPEHIMKLIGLIQKEGYRYIVLDIKLFGAASVPLLKSADKIWVPCPTEWKESDRITEWKRQLSSIGVDLSGDSCITVPYDGLIKSGCENGMLLKGRLGRFIEEMEGKRYVR
ncbi:MAG: hypothetical protein K6E95_04945 [Lachnospiraceae bacterium]|nr:hypothetical protein [Lachnospiraceae bacterium]